MPKQNTDETFSFTLTRAQVESILTDMADHGVPSMTTSATTDELLMDMVHWFRRTR